MKKNWLLIGGIILVLLAVVLMVSSSNSPADSSAHHNSTSVPAATAPHDHAAGANAQTIPAHFEVPPSKSSLGPTLAPEKFTGITRDAYRAAREIPVTLAQLPCYCHCDRGLARKSLYSCFQDDHASHCDVCVREAVLAYKLEKEQKMTPAQIRDTIIAQYSQ